MFTKMSPLNSDTIRVRGSGRRMNSNLTGSTVKCIRSP